MHKIDHYPWNDLRIKEFFFDWWFDFTRNNLSQKFCHSDSICDVLEVILLLLDQVKWVNICVFNQKWQWIVMLILLKKVAYCNIEKQRNAKLVFKKSPNTYWTENNEVEHLRMPDN